VKCAGIKSQKAIERALAKLGISRGWRIDMTLSSDIPKGKGLASSTADMLASLRAVQSALSFLTTDEFISTLFSEIEPHDALHYDSSVIYNHRKGILIRDLHYVPAFTLVAVDNGGTVDTVAYNKNLFFSTDDVRAYDQILSRLTRAFQDLDEVAIAACATRSTELFASRTKNIFLSNCLGYAMKVDALGVQAAHSGTCAGFLFPAKLSPSTLRGIVDKLKGDFSRTVFATETLTLLR
jgi:uncharacterized protein involved in propanediol utilization